MAQIISRKDAENARVGPSSETDASKDATLHDAEAKAVEVSGRKQYFALQDKWSNWIIGWISGLLIFNCWLVILVGAGKLSYAATPWLITAFVTEIFLQVIGLGYIAARFLFPGSPATERAPGRAKRKAKAIKPDKTGGAPVAS